MTLHEYITNKMTNSKFMYTCMYITLDDVHVSMSCREGQSKRLNLVHQMNLVHHIWHIWWPWGIS